MMILVGLLVFDRELRVIHTFTSTFASRTFRYNSVDGDRI